MGAFTPSPSQSMAPFYVAPADAGGFGGPMPAAAAVRSTPQGVKIPGAVRPTKSPLEAIAAVTKAWAAKAASAAARAPGGHDPSGVGIETAAGPLADSFRGSMGYAQPAAPGSAGVMQGMQPDRTMPPNVYPPPTPTGPPRDNAFDMAGKAISSGARAFVGPSEDELAGRWSQRGSPSDPPNAPTPLTPPRGGAAFVQGPPASQGGAFGPPPMPSQPALRAGPPSAAAADDITITLGAPPEYDPALPPPPAAAASPAAAAPPARGRAFAPPAPAAGPLDGHDPEAVAGAITGVAKGDPSLNPAGAFGAAGYDSTAVDKLYDELRKQTGHNPKDDDLTSEDKAQVMMELGLSIMAAGGQHGQTFLGAIGAGGLQAMGSWRQMKAQRKAENLATDASRRDILKTGIEVGLKQEDTRAKFVDAALTREQRSEDRLLDRQSRADIARENNQARQDLKAFALANRQAPPVAADIQNYQFLTGQGIPKEEALQRVYGSGSGTKDRVGMIMEAATKADAAATAQGIEVTPEVHAANLEQAKRDVASLTGGAPAAAPTAPATSGPPVSGAIPGTFQGKPVWKAPDGKLYAR